MTIEEVMSEYKQISQLLDKKWPMEDKRTRRLARVTKIVEEFGELADEVLKDLNLQRTEKNTEVKDQLAEEFADMLSAVLLLGNELEIDVSQALVNHINKTKNRYQE